MPLPTLKSPYKRIVIKIGTSLLTGGSSNLNRPWLIEFVRQCATLHRNGVEVIVVSSGAMAAGRECLGFPSLPPEVPAKQMLSAVGQPWLMELYRQYLGIYGINSGQLLLTRADLKTRRRYLNAYQTLEALLKHQLLPVINENDSVTSEEIRVGDNDNLSAMVATMAEADLLVLLTDQDGLYTADPRLNPDAILISEVKQIDAELLAMAGDSTTKLGTGGMATKLQAAELATQGGVTVVIAAGANPDILSELAKGNMAGTRFLPRRSHPERRKRWLLAGYTTEGSLVVDVGAEKALTATGSSLLPVGVLQINGAFNRGDTISIFDQNGREIARGLVQYPSDDLNYIKGNHSQFIEEILGYEYGEEVIHRDDLIVFV